MIRMIGLGAPLIVLIYYSFRKYRQKENDYFLSTKNTKLDNILTQILELFNYKNEVDRFEFIDILTKRSFTYANCTMEEKEKFSRRLKNIYFSMSGNKYACVVMKIVSLFPNIVILFMTKDDSVLEECGMDGVTVQSHQKIAIACKDFCLDNGNEKKERTLMGLIIHELCHFAIYATFRNNCHPYYDNNETQINNWKEVVEECELNRKIEELIDEAFNLYEPSKLTNELVVRFLQHSVEFEEKHNKIHGFQETYPKLSKIFTSQIYESFNVEMKNIQSIFYLNFDMCEKVKKFVGNITIDLIKIETGQKTLLITNQTFLLMFSIFKMCQREVFFEWEYVFILASDLLDSKKSLYIQHVFENDHIKHFIIEWNILPEKQDDSESVRKILLCEKFTKHCSVTVVVEKEQISGIIFDDFHEHKIDVTADKVDEDFFKNIEVVYQGEYRFLSKLIDFFDFKSQHELPTCRLPEEKINLDSKIQLNFNRPKLIENIDLQEKMFSKIKHEKYLSLSIESLLDSEDKITEIYKRLTAEFPAHLLISLRLSDILQNITNENSYESLSEFSNFLFTNLLKYKNYEKMLLKTMMQSNKIFFLILDNIIHELSDEEKKDFQTIITSIKSYTNCKIVLANRPRTVTEELQTLIGFKHQKLEKLFKETNPDEIDAIENVETDVPSKLNTFIP